MRVQDPGATDGQGNIGGGSAPDQRAPLPDPVEPTTADALDTTPVERGKVSRWSLRNWRLRSKLAAVMIVPTVTALALGGLLAAQELDRANEFQQTVDQLDLAAKSATVLHEVQNERTLAVAKIASDRAPDEGALDAQIIKTDRAIADMKSFAGTLETDVVAEGSQMARTLDRIDALGPLRIAVRNTSYADLSALSAYTAVLDQLIQAGREVNTGITDRDLLRRGTTAQALSEAKEYVSRENAALQIAGRRDGFPAELLSQTRAYQASARAALDTFRSTADPEQVQLYNDNVSGAEVDDRERIKASAFVFADARSRPAIDVNALTNDGTFVVDRMNKVEGQLLADLRSAADGLASDALVAFWQFAAIVLLALLFAIALMLIIARSLLHPLRTLRTNALDVAYAKLPTTVQGILDNPNPLEAAKRAVEPVPVLTREEIGEVARSFDAVHAQAVKLAAEQALLRENVNGMFVNLSRRSQRLVERQLGVIDRLEADEQDPDHLASLFELDHLATRLRRNGESLLVLSGAGLTKSVSRPVPAVEVIGAAVSEIEQYARVEVGQVPEVSVQGRAIQDLVHLLAELLDNATYFSEPETRVTMRAAVTRKRSLAIQITDKGVGMSEEDIEEANKRLADPPAFDVSVTRRMGLYVVARLAKRHGIEVRLRDNEEIDNGIIARIVVPAELLVATPAAQSLGGPPSQPRIPAQAPMLPPTPTQSSLPPITPVYQQQKPEPPTETWTPAPPPPTPAETSMATNGLTPLAQPISLDDLVAGSPNAAFTSRPTDAPLPTSYPVSQQLPVRQVPAPPPPPAPPAAEPAAQEDFGFPTEEPDQPGTDYSDYEALAKQPADDDPDAPTRRLPIYQSVMSRWFSEVEDELDERPPASSSAPASSELAGPAPETDRSREADRSREPSAEAEPSALPKRVPAEPEQSGFPKRTPDPEAEPEPEVAQEAPAVPEQPTSTPQPEYTEGPPPKPRPVVASTWQSASDQGWQAAQALLETRNEEVTEAGLPKRVPNAYLVPGSVNAPEQDAFRDTSVGQPSPSAISRSAAAARSRMASFQRGFTTGRHALSESSAEPGSYPGAGNSRTEQGTREWQ
ncbi:nitrate- and nitrite sensing domain-containing protein [Amycolatopsis sp. 195334CR]|uniref:sensor histidine kinase n=1 Tax=Amycolatopsis sp. 195334CR TaxID=2814588 RepID=UPI0027DD0ACE|nr:nitrate- and nitrite sensing domain-containing protein [Amycolatopsis sp. 195334CR]